MHLLPITIDDRPPLHKRARYTSYLIPSAISFASEISVSTLTTTSNQPDTLPTCDPNTIHVMNKDVPLKGRVHIGNCCRKHEEKYATKIQGSIAPHALMKTRYFINVTGFPGLIHQQGLVSCNI